MTEINKSSQQIIKESNMRMVFGLIHQHEVISRADIKKITSLSATTVSSLVEELIGENFVLECGMKETKTSGRKAIMLKIHSDGGYFIGLDVRKNHIFAQLCGLDFAIKESLEVSVKKGDSLVTGILHAVEHLGKGKRVLGVTLGLPGVIDPKTNTVISSTVLAIEDVKDIYSVLKEAMPDVNIYIKNNSGLVALCEREFGGHAQINNLISIDIDDGVGAGVLVDGVIYDGNDGFAGEFGHISVNLNGRKCSCGNYGCLELYASVPQILESTKTDSLRSLREKLDQNDEQVIKGLGEVSKALAFGINNIVNILNPELIVIGGDAPLLGERFLEMIKDVFFRISLIKDTDIVLSGLTENPVAMGGVRYAFDMIFSK